MPIFDRFKQLASGAAFEADRALRLNRVESKVRQLRDQAREQTLALGALAAQVHGNGRLTCPELQPLAQIVVDLDAQIAELEREATAIRAEGDQHRIEAYGHLCSKERLRIPGDAVFCPNCGATAIDVEPPPVAAPRICARCAKTVEVAGNFCPECGGKLVTPEGASELEEPAFAPGASAVCAQCGTALSEDAVFCSNCGTRH